MKIKKIPLLFLLISSFSFAQNYTDKSIFLGKDSLTISGNIGSYKLKLNGIIISDRSESTALGFNSNFKNKFLIENEYLTIVSDAISATCTEYFIVKIKSETKKEYTISQNFGTCDDDPTVTQKGNEIIFKMKDFEGRLKIFTYSNGNIKTSGKP